MCPDVQFRQCVPVVPNRVRIAKSNQPQSLPEACVFTNARFPVSTS
jgi:hypothetical protein